MTHKTVRVERLARVEGEGGLTLSIKGGKVNHAKLKIFEPPRFFEAFLRGRHYSEASDLTARICGICPVAYQMSAVHAMEALAGAAIPQPIADLRRLLYCGEWIESHALHVFMLHAPDFLGYDDAIEMAKDQADVVKRGLSIKKAGNAIVTLVGGREIHPINVRVGGAYHAPSRDDLLSLLPLLKPAADDVEKTLQWAETLDYPDFEGAYEFVSLHHDTEYPFIHGDIKSSAGLKCRQGDLLDHISEIQVRHSTALHAGINDRGRYLTGPMARFNLNRATLKPRARAAAQSVGLGDGCRNPFKSLLVRLIETLHAFETAIGLIEGYAPPTAPCIDIETPPGVAAAATEAPRGLLFHRYEIDDDGLIRKATIIPPTSQNQPTIEEDIKAIASNFLDRPEEELTLMCERSVRNHDPCISCSTHFLKVTIERDNEAQP